MRRPTLPNGQPKPPTAEITGRQFNWDVRYPGRDGELHTLDDIVRVDGDIHFPAHEEVVLVIKSADVLHSFFLPNLRMKQDVVPGMDQYMWFKARETGSYDIVCAELCGWGHYKMKGRATFEPRSQFDAWLKEKYDEQTTRTVAANETAEE
jgi:cytochrome c oxidase subunit 2